MNKKRKLINALLVSTMMLSGLALDVSAAEATAVDRIGGKDRVETSVNVSNRAYADKADAVVVAGWEGQPDALTGTLLASAKDAPLLLVSNKDDDIASVRAEIERLGAKTLYILGDTNVVTQKAEDALGTGLTVKRVKGDDRFDTAVAVAKEVGSKTGHAFITVDGRSGELADALAAGPASGKNNSPILLTSKNSLPAQTKQALKDLNISSVTIVGGTSAVSTAVETAIKAEVSTVNRVYGDDRWETAEEVAKTYFAEADKAIITNDGRVSYADALVGGYFGALNDAPILLTQAGKLNAATTNFLGGRAMSAFVLGKEGVVSTAVKDAVGAIVDKNIEDAKEEALVVESVSAINAKTLKVTMNRAVSAEDQAKAKVEAKRGSIKPSVKEVKFAKDGKSVTIEFNANMIAGDYTVTVSGLTEEALTGTAKVEAEKLTEINFLSETAIISGDNVTTRVEARNQYGEVVNKELNSSKSNISVTASKGTPGSHTINNEGLLTVVGTSGDFKADNKVVVTIVDSSTGVTATKTLTVVQSAQVESIEVGELTTDDEELAKKPVNVTNMGSNASDYYIPVTVKDQYGNTLKAADLNGDVDVLSSNKKVVQVADTAFADLKDVGTVIKFKAPEATATHGTAVLTIVAPGTGKSANVSVEVLKDAEIDTLTVSAPEKALKQNVKVDLPFSAADQYGDMLESSTELVKHSSTSSSKIVFANNDGSAGASINATGANLDYSIDYGNKNKVKLHITPTAKNIVLTSVSATGKAQTINLTAEEAPEASSLAGISKDIFTAMQKGEYQVISHTHVIINDQYGDSIGLPNGYKLKFAAEDGTLDNVTLNNAEITNTGTTSTTLRAAVKGNEAIKITLNDGTKDLDTVVVTFETVELKDITEFGLKEVGKIYTGKAADVKYGNIPGDYNKSLEIFGKKGSKEVLVDQGLLLSATSTAPIVVNGLGIDHQEVTTNGVDKTATLTAVIQGADSPITATQELVYSDAKSLVSKVTVRETTGSKAEITDGAVVVPTGKIDGKEIGPKATTDASTFQFYAKDQYGVEVTNLDYTVTNLKSSNSEVSKVEVNNGTISVTDSGTNGLQAGDTFTITAIVDGIVTTVKVIVGA